MANDGNIDSKNAVAFVQRHGMVLESGRGPVPSLAEAVAGQPIRGSWWGHAKGHEIFAATRAVRESSQVLVCRLIAGKVTYIHSRLWPAVVRLADQLGKERLAAIREVHMPTGSHRAIETPFPDWVLSDVQVAARSLSQDEAICQLGDHLAGVVMRGSSTRNKKK